MDKIELVTKMTNWGYAVVKVRVDANVECALEALQEAEGVVNTRLISDPYDNIKVSFKPSMLDKSISEGRKVTLFFLKIKHKSITNFKLFTTFQKN